MYNLIPHERYSYHLQNMLRDLGPMSFSTKSSIFGHISFNISQQTILYFIMDYAAFLAHNDKWKKSGNVNETIHLGLNVVNNFSAFWDHIGYEMNLIFELGKKPENTCYRDIIGKMCNTKNKRLKKQCVKLQQIYDNQKDIRDYYRNPYTHRIHECFFKRNESDTPKSKLIRLSESLDKCYKELIKAFRIYYEIIDKYSPKKDFGSYPK